MLVVTLMTTIIFKNYCPLLGKEVLTQYFTNNWIRVEELE